MTNEELFQARTNPDFLKYLNEARENAIKEQNISLMYETLDSMLVLNLDEDKITSLYEEILKLSFQKVEDILNENNILSLEDEQLLYIRALYEHSVEKWTNDNFDGAKELLFVIANIVNDDILKKAINCMIVFLIQGLKFDEFYDSFVDVNFDNQDEKYGYFIVNFNFEKDSFLKKNSSCLEEEYKKLEYLINKRK